MRRWSLLAASSLWLGGSTYGLAQVPAPAAPTPQLAPMPSPLSNTPAAATSSSVPVPTHRWETSAADYPTRPFPGDQAVPIDLSTALRLAFTNNTDIDIARRTIDIATANRERALALWLPNIGGFGGFVDHDGRIQQANGNILNVNRRSLTVGGQLQQSANFADVFYLPLVARQQLRATEANLQRVTNDTLLAVTEAYLNVLRQRRRLARIDDTLDFLSSPKPSERRAKSKGLLPLIRDFVEVGGRDALASELYRVQTETFRRQEERAAILAELEIARAELSRLLRLDATVPLTPVEDFRQELPMPCKEWIQRELDTLVEQALRNRPELAENQLLLQAALTRWKQAKMRPWAPNLGVNYFAGGFGGGPIRNTNLKETDPVSGPIDKKIADYGRFGPRSDFEVTLGWRLNNFGVGNLADIRESKARAEQAQFQLIAAQNRVIAQVVSAYEQWVHSKERLDLVRAALFDAQGRMNGPVFRSLELNFERIRGGEGRPLEVLDSIRGLNDLLEAYAQALTDYERAQYRLLIAIGVPAQQCIPPSSLETLAGSDPRTAP